MSDVTDLFYGIADDVKQGYGAQLLVGVGDGSPESFQAVKGIVSIHPGSLDTPRIKVTHLRSLRRANEYIPGTRDFAAFAFKARWLPDDDSQSNQPGNGTSLAPGLLYLNTTSALWNFVVKLNDGSPESEYPFRGFVSKFAPGEADADGVFDLDVEISPVADYTGSLP